MRTIALGMAALGLALAAPAAFCQAAAPPAAAYKPPHTPWGAPDLQGNWTNSSITRLTRPSGVPNLVLTPAEAKALEDKDYNNVRTNAEKAPTNPNEGAPEKGKPLPPVGNYNAVWVDPGSKVGKVRGEYRSSWIVEPANGQMPLSDAGRKLLGGNRGPVGGPASAYDGPESRSPGERCLIGFGGTGGPVMLNVLYNNQYQIVQTPTHAVIDVEMVHDARIVPLTKDRKRPAAIKQWLGDSIGWYEGDTLVVETRNVHPQQRGPVYISAAGKLTERFTRVAANELLYQFEVDDPATYTQVWRGEIPFAASPEPPHEYACHEGNHAMIGILAGARVQEKSGKKLASTPDSE